MGKHSDRLLPYLYSTPFFILMCVFMLLPFILNIGMSFTNYSISKQGYAFVGLKNYLDLSSNARVADSIARTFAFIAGIVSLTMLLGMFYAMVMALPLRGVGFLKAIILLPWIIPESVTGYVWKWLMSADSGIVYYWLGCLGLIGPDTSFFFDGKLAMLLIVAVNVWRTTPFVAIMTYAQLKAIPQSHLEAAQIDGANAFKALLYIKLPWLWPILKRCMTLLFVWSFNSFAIIYILTNGGPAGATTTLPYLIRQTAFNDFNFGKAATLSVLSLILILASWLLLRGMMKLWSLGGRGRSA